MGLPELSEPQPIQTLLNIHGIEVVVRSPHPDIANWLNFDFSYFIVPAQTTAVLSIEIFLEPPSDQLIPELASCMHSPEFVCYDQGHLRFVDYYKRALVIFDYSNEHARFYSTDLSFLYEKLYLLILSRVGEHLDRQGLHRVHALGISFRGQSALFLMPSGGGKSTLALSLLENPEVKLSSEDTPHINSKGQVFPFPLRLGLRQQRAGREFPGKFVRNFSREKWGTKTLLHIDYFRAQIENEPRQIEYLFAGKWLNSTTPRIEKLSRFTALMTLFRDCVFGLGLPQIVEYFLTTNKRDLVRKSHIALRRIYAVTILVFRSKPRRIYLSRDTEANKKLILGYMENGS